MACEAGPLEPRSLCDELSTSFLPRTFSRTCSLMVPSWRPVNTDVHISHSFSSLQTKSNVSIPDAADPSWELPVDSIQIQHQLLRIASSPILSHYWRTVEEGKRKMLKIRSTISLEFLGTLTKFDGDNVLQSHCHCTTISPIHYQIRTKNTCP